MPAKEDILRLITKGCTDLILEYLHLGFPPSATDDNGVSLIKWCAYYGDVTAIKVLLDRGESLQSLGENFDLNGAAFHGYWRLCQFLLENGADVNHPLPDTGETPLHAALSKSSRHDFSTLIKVLLDYGANPNLTTKANVETDAFMRDIRTKGESALHRAAAFAPEDVIEMLLKAGAKRDLKDINGDSPLTWASWHLRSRPILKLLCYDNFTVRV
jgi:uncharacterized protein